MPKRDPNGPIPGFEDEYTGTVGFEKAIHHTHFQGVMQRPTHPKDDPNWEYAGVGKWRLKHLKVADVSAGVTDDD